MAKIDVQVTLYMSEIIYEVQNKTYLTGRSRSNGTNHEEVANMQANDDDEDYNQVVRSIGNAYDTLKTKLSEYLEGSSTGITANNKQIDPSVNLTLTLKMPSNYNPATKDTVCTAINQYIVNCAIGDWFMITNKNDATDYVTKASAYLEQVREAINKRVRPKRKEYK